MAKDKLPKGLQEIPGRLWVRAHYKQDGVNDAHVLIDDEVWVSTAIFQPEETPGSATVHLERTIQVKQYEPLDVHVGCTVPSRAEELDGAIEFALGKVGDHFMPAVRKAHEAMMKIRKGR